MQNVKDIIHEQLGKLESEIQKLVHATRELIANSVEGLKGIVGEPALDLPYHIKAVAGPVIETSFAALDGNRVQSSTMWYILTKKF